jgi:hypothetical protein
LRFFFEVSRNFDMKQQPLDFIHIGLGKCASTYLQNVFNSDPDFNLFDLANIVALSVEKSREGANPKDFSDVTISMDPSILSYAHKFNVSSAEGFTFVSEQAHYENILSLYKVSAHFLGKSQLSLKVLLMIRNPVEWIRAAHEQSIKEGGFGSYGEYYEKEKTYLENSLNIKEIINEYANYFDVFTLSADQLRSEPDDFWELFSKNLDVGVPKKEIREQVSQNKLAVNASLKGRRHKLAMLNKFSSAKNNSLRGLEDYFALIPEEAHMSLKLSEHEKWSNRRIVEFATPEQLDTLTAHFEDIDDTEFTRTYIDQHMKDHLLINFIEPLEKSDLVPRKLIDTYLDSINTALI